MQAENVYAECGMRLFSPDQNRGRIVKGNVARHGDYPWVGMFNYPPSCGVILIPGTEPGSSRYALTAAHCVKLTSATFSNKWKNQAQFFLRNDGTQGRVVFGVHAIDQEESPDETAQERAIVRIAKANHFIDGVNDIALLQLDRPLIYDANSSFIRPICLPRSGVEPSVDKSHCYTAGFGQVGRGEHRPSMSNPMYYIN